MPLKPLIIPYFYRNPNVNFHNKDKHVKILTCLNRKLQSPKNKSQHYDTTTNNTMLDTYKIHKTIRDKIMHKAYYLNFAWIELTEPEGIRYEVMGLRTAELVQRRYKASSMKLYLSTANA